MEMRRWARLICLKPFSNFLKLGMKVEILICKGKGHLKT
jgi:hypothetical protein